MFWKRVNPLVKTLNIVPIIIQSRFIPTTASTEAKSLQKSSYAWLAHLCPCPTDDSSIQGAHGNTPLPLKQGQWSFTNHCINNSLLTSVYALHGNSGILESYINAQSSPASTGLKILINHCIKQLVKLITWILLLCSANWTKPPTAIPLKHWNQCNCV